LERGVAAISYESVDDLDLSKWLYNEPAEQWSQLSSSQKASIRRVAYEMRKGDIIYVKQGTRIVGRGKVLGGYTYRLNDDIIDDSGDVWPHQVPVKWETDFTPISILLGGELITVLKLTDAHLRLLGKAESSAR
jgi:predicted Mrr-cat superfamily restriction endonuclease